FGRLVDHFPSLLEREIVGSCENLLDVACGSCSPVRTLSRKLSHTVGVDGFRPSIERSRAAGIHDEYLELDIRQLGERVPARSYDAVVALDLIEHLTKDEGLKLLKDMETIARKKVILFTPNGFLPQEPYDG